MQKKFQKGDMEWEMFREYYSLIQTYAIPETDDAWVNRFVQDMVDFGEKYGLFGRKLALAYIEVIKTELAALNVA